MKKIKILISLIITLPIICSTVYAQKTGISPKNNKGEKEQTNPQKKKKGGQYQDFELTQDNIEWAKLEIDKEKDKAEKELREGKITKDEFDIRIKKIAKAERKVKDFESGSAILNVTKGDKGDDSSVKRDDTGKPGELVGKNDGKEEKQKARMERERKRKEANMAKANSNRMMMEKDRIIKEKENLEKEKSEGKISSEEYIERLTRIEQSEKRILGQEKNAKKSIKEKTKNGSDSSKPTNIEPIQKSASIAEQNQVKANEELEKSVEEGDRRISEAKLRIQSEKLQLEKDKKEGIISDQQYNTKKAKIESVEKAIEDLEKSVKKGKEL